MSVQAPDQEEDAFDMGGEDEQEEQQGWCFFCPSFCGMGVMTFLMALLGIGFGAMLYEVKVQNAWLNCYKSPSKDEKQSCWLEVIYWPGYLWIRTLKLLVLPLMATMVLTLPEKMANIKPVGIRLIALLTFTSFVAALEGLFWGNVLQPGKNVASSAKTDGPGSYISELESFLNIFTLFFPQNIFDELVNSRVIGTISFFLVLGVQVQKGPKVWADPIFNVAKGIMRAVLRLLVHVMWFTPIAMFSLISYNIAKIGDLWNVLEAVGKYVGVQILGQFLHLTIFYFGFYFFATGKNPIRYLWQIKAAPVTALITSSSAATMPVTLRVNKAVGNDERLVSFCIPLGAGMNMDGTSLGFPIMVLFAAQVINHDVSGAQQLTLALLAMVCSLGTAPVPQAGLVFLQMLFIAIDLPPTGQEIGFALIAMFDWLVDRVETAQNVTSDSFICAILSHYFKGGKGPLMCCMKGMVSEEELDKAVPYHQDDTANTGTAQSKI